MIATEHIPLETHNGTITISSAKSGEHRTFRIRTWIERGTDAAGKETREPKLDRDGKVVRVIELLAGPDNETAYVGFGFVHAEPGNPAHGIRPGITVSVWQKCRGGQYEKYGRMLELLDEHIEAGRIDVRFAGACRRCNRKLTTPASIDAGIGPVCGGRE